MESKGFWKGILVGFILAACAVTGGYLGYRHGLFSGRYVLSDAAHVEKIKSLEELIDGYYLEEKDPENLAEGLYAGLLYGLDDPYSGTTRRMSMSRKIPLMKAPIQASALLCRKTGAAGWRLKSATKAVRRSGPV